MVTAMDREEEGCGDSGGGGVCPGRFTHIDI